MELQLDEVEDSDRNIFANSNLSIVRRGSSVTVQPVAVRPSAPWILPLVFRANPATNTRLFNKTQSPTGAWHNTAGNIVCCLVHVSCRLSLGKTALGQGYQNCYAETVRSLGISKWCLLGATWGSLFFITVRLTTYLLPHHPGGGCGCTAKGLPLVMMS